MSVNTRASLIMLALIEATSQGCGIKGSQTKISFGGGYEAYPSEYASFSDGINKKQRYFIRLCDLEAAIVATGVACEVAIIVDESGNAIALSPQDATDDATIVTCTKIPVEGSDVDYSISMPEECGYYEETGYRVFVSGQPTDFYDIPASSFRELSDANMYFIESTTGGRDKVYRLKP